MYKVVLLMKIPKKGGFLLPLRYASIFASRSCLSFSTFSLVASFISAVSSAISSCCCCSFSNRSCWRSAASSAPELLKYCDAEDGDDWPTDYAMRSIFFI